MTYDEWRPIAALAENLWKDGFDEAREQAYYEALAPYEAEHVRKAVVNLGGRPGDAWAPSSSQIAAEVADVQRVGTWDWAVEQIDVLMREAMEIAQLRWQTEPGSTPTVTTADLPAAGIAKLVNAEPVYGPMVLQLIDLATPHRLWLHSHDSGFRTVTLRRGWAQVTHRAARELTSGS